MMLRRSVCVLAFLLAASDLHPFVTAADKVVLPGDSLQARNRLQAIDQLLDPAVSPRDAAACIARLGMGRAPLEAVFALAPLVTVKQVDFWEQIEEAYYYLLNDSGDALISFDPGPFQRARTSLQVRRACQLRLAGLPSFARRA